MNILLLEDDKSILNYYAGIVSQTIPEANVLTASNGKMAIEIARTEQLDLMILDMELDEEKKVLGLDYAKEIKTANGSVDFIVISGNSSYFEESTNIKPYYYFMKPLDTEFFERKLMEWHLLKDDDFKKHNKHIKVVTKSGISSIALNSIIYVEKVDRHVVIRTATKDYTIKDSLKSMKKLLDERFYETHQSFIVNIEEIKELKIRENRSWDVLFHNVEDFAILSRYKSKSFIKEFEKHKSEIV